MFGRHLCKTLNYWSPVFPTDFFLHLVSAAFFFLLRSRIDDKCATGEVGYAWEFLPLSDNRTKCGDKDVPFLPVNQKKKYQTVVMDVKGCDKQVLSNTLNMYNWIWDKPWRMFPVRLHGNMHWDKWQYSITWSLARIVKKKAVIIAAHWPCHSRNGMPFAKC